MNERALDAHSVNCLRCSVLFDERDGYTPDDGEGTLCSACFCLTLKCGCVIVTTDVLRPYIDFCADHKAQSESNGG